MVNRHASKRSPRRGRVRRGVLVAASAALALVLVLVLDSGAAWGHASSGGNSPSIAHRLAELGPGALVGIAVAVYVVLAFLDQTASRLGRDRRKTEEPVGHD